MALVGQIYSSNDNKRIEFGSVSQINPPYFSTTGGSAFSFGQCTWYCDERVKQITGRYAYEFGLRNHGCQWWINAKDANIPVYNGAAEALKVKDTIAGMLGSFGCNGTVFLGSNNHVIFFEGQDEQGHWWASEMYGSVGDGKIYLTDYTSVVNSPEMHLIDIGIKAEGSGGYIKKKLLKGKDFCWKSPPVEEGKGEKLNRGDMLPTKKKYGEFLELLNKAQEIAKVKEDKRIKFSVDQDKGILTAKRFNQYLYLMQESREGSLKGVDKKVEKMKDVKVGDLLKADHFNKLAELFNHWKYGYLVDFHNAVMNEIWAFFSELGWQPGAIAGVMGNIQQEVGPNFNPDIFNRQGDGGYGICQWTYSRRTAFENYMVQHHLNRASVTDQLKYLMYELESNAQFKASPLGVIQNETDPKKAAHTWFYYYEACVPWGGAMDTTGPQREANAEQIYNMAMSSGSGDINGNIDLSDLPQIRQKLVKAAQSQLGTPYVWGGTTPYVGLDCSGLIQYCYKVCGINISRTTYTQQNEVRIISRNTAQPGDVIYWTDSDPAHSYHVAMYVGNNTIIEAPAPGDVVKYNSLSQKHSNYFFATFF